MVLVCGWIKPLYIYAEFDIYIDSSSDQDLDTVLVLVLVPTHASLEIGFLFCEIRNSCSTLPACQISEQTRNGKALVHC